VRILLVDDSCLICLQLQENVGLCIHVEIVEASKTEKVNLKLLRIVKPDLALSNKIDDVEKMSLQAI